MRWLIALALALATAAATAMGRQNMVLGSIEGAAIGALIVGMARSVAVHTAPVAELFAIYLVMAVVLMFRPEGLFQRVQARKI